MTVARGFDFLVDYQIMNSYERGNETERAVISRCLDSGKQIAIPVGVKRFDLLIEIDGRFQKCQIKTGRVKNGSLVFLTSTVNPVTGKRRPYTKEDVEYFIVRNPETGDLYKVPFNEVGDCEFTLRLEPLKKKQKDGKVHFAEQYLF